MKRILANDGIDAAGKKILEDAGFFVETTRAPEVRLTEVINGGNFDVLLVRSATKVTSGVMEACPGLRLIGRAGVGLDNIDVKWAEANGIKVVNTPAASSQSVAELVFAHLYAGVRFLHDSNHKMRLPEARFPELKKAYAGGIELMGKTIGIIGFGRIGQAVARIALGSGMKVIAADPYIQEAVIKIQIPQAGQSLDVKIATTTLDNVLAEADFISLHVPGLVDGKALIGATEIRKMKKGAAIVNASRGGVIDEDALLHALDTGHLSFAGLDVFVNEPNPRADVLHHPRISLSPHIGASTAEAQERIGLEMAANIIAFFKST